MLWHGISTNYLQNQGKCIEVPYLFPMLESRLVGLLLVPAEEDLANGVPDADEIVVAHGNVL